MSGTAIYANQPKSTLAGSISNVSTSLTVASGTGALFPNPGAGQYFSVTLQSASNASLLEICYCTARSGDVMTVTRAQEGTTALNWNAGDLAIHLVTAGDLNGFAQSVNTRTKLTGNLTIYVNNITGNNTNSGLSPSVPLHDPQAAITLALANYDAANLQTITIQLADSLVPYGPIGGGNGSVAAFGGVPVGAVGDNNLVLQGNVITPANVVLSATNGTAVLAIGSTQVTLTGLTLEATGSGSNGSGIVSELGSNVSIGPAVVFGACATSHMLASIGGKILGLSGNSYTVNGAAPIHWNANNQGQISIQGMTVQINGTPAFGTAFASVANQGLIYVPGNTFSGSATGQRWAMTDLGLIYTGTSGSTSYLPGSSNGPANGAGGTNNAIYD